MNNRKRSVSSSVLLSVSTTLVSLSCAISAAAQATSTATQTLALSAFAAGTGTYTGLYTPDGRYLGKNLGITVGADLRVSHIGRYYPSIEVRGTYPFHKGSVDSLKNVLGGVKIERPFLHDRVHPYAALLYGRGEIDYQSGGYYVPSSSLIYYYSVSNVFAPTAGVDVDVTDHFAVKADAQFAHYSTPATDGGSIAAVPISLGLIYRFDFNHHQKYPSGR